MEKTTTVVSKAGEKEGSERVVIGNVEYLQPTLAELGLTGGTEVRDEKTQELGYAEPAIAWVWKAVKSSTRSAALSRLVTQSVEYKPGQAAWTDVEDMITAAEGGKGAHFTIRKGFAESFNAFIDSLNKSVAFSANIKTLADLPISKKTTPALAAIDDGTKKVFGKYLSQYVASLSDGDVSKFQTILAELEACCNVTQRTLEDE